MSSNSRASYSSKLTNAEILIEDLNTFTDYEPGDESLTAEALLERTTKLRAVQTQHTEKHYDYSQAAFDRRKFFDNEDNSISKLVSPIGANIRGKFGKTSQQYNDVRALTLKIRGQKRIKVTENSDEDTISRSEKSFGSQLIYFGDIITLLGKFGSGYTPVNPKIQIDKLQTVATDATKATNLVSEKLAVYKPVIKQRVDEFKELSEVAQRIKNMVSSQYGVSSPQYKLVKGLKI